MARKNIYTYGGQPARRNLTVADIIALRGKRTLTQTTADNAEEAAACEAAGIDLISIWDSDIDEIRKGASETFVTGGIGMTAYHTPDEILRAAIIVAEKGADAVYTPRGLHIVEMLAREGLAVQGHLGLVPRKSTLVGGLRAIGKTAEEALELYHAFRRLEDAGAYAVEVECVADQALREIAKRSKLVTHSIGAGSGGDIIFTFMSDICGETETRPRHARAFGELHRLRTRIAQERGAALQAYSKAVTEGSYPGPNESIFMSDVELDKLRNALEALPASL